MYHASVNGTTYDIEFRKGTTQGSINGQDFSLDILEQGEGSSHVIFQNKSYSIEVVQFDKETKQAIVKVNGTKYPVFIKDRFDDLLKSLGMEGAGTAKLKDLKAPMPGMVLNIMVNEGDAVEKDTPLIILEAMKMENVIKSPAAGTVKRVIAKKGVAVEKNSILIEFA